MDHAAGVKKRVFSGQGIRLMPHKFNARCCHKIAKKRYRVTNWREYNDSLRNRGDLTIWITGDAQKK